MRFEDTLYLRAATMRRGGTSAACTGGNLNHVINRGSSAVEDVTSP
jgi:hypothetical protein